MKKATVFFFPKSNLIDIVLSVEQKTKHVNLLSYCKELKELFISNDISFDLPIDIKETSIKLGYNDD